MFLAEALPATGPEEMAWLKGLLWLLLVIGIVDKGSSVLRKFFGAPEKPVATEITGQPLTFQKHEPPVGGREVQEVKQRVAAIEAEIHGMGERIAKAGQQREDRIQNRMNEIGESLAKLIGTVEAIDKRVK